MEMTAPSSGPPGQPYNAGVFALRMLIILVGGWVLVTIATGVMMEAAGGAFIAVRVLLPLAWYALIALEAYRWWVAARARRLAPAPLARPAASKGGRWPVWGTASLVAPVLVTLLFRDAFVVTPLRGGGESALFAFVTVIMLGALGLLTGIACGAVSVYMKELRWLGAVGILANLVTGVVLANQVMHL